MTDKIKKQMGAYFLKMQKVSDISLKNDSIEDIINLYNEWKNTDILYLQNNYYELDFLWKLKKYEADKIIVLNAVLYYLKYYNFFIDSSFHTLHLFLIIENNFEEPLFPWILYSLDKNFSFKWTKIYDNWNTAYIKQIFADIWLFKNIELFTFDEDANIYIDITNEIE